jgi:uncharacterized protein YcfJ
MTSIRKTLSITALATVLALPQANAASCHSRKFNGTVIGGIGGALLGGAVTHGSTGPIVGGLAGAVVGHEVGRNGCTSRTYYRTSRTRQYYRSAPARYYAPARPAPRQVYYDQYGAPVYNYR